MNKRFKALVGPIVGCASLLATSVASASTLSFSLTTTNPGSASADTDVVLTDVAGGVKFLFTVSDALNTADVVAVYMDFAGGLPSGWGGTYPTPTGWSYIPNDGSVITGFGFNTNNVAAGNIGQVFDLGLAIGSTGSSADYFSSFTFTLFAVGLDVTDFLGQTFAVRGQTVGAPPCDVEPNECDGSAKESGTAPLKVDDPISQPPEVPLPAGIWLLLSAVGAFGFGGWRRRRLSAA